MISHRWSISIAVALGLCLAARAPAAMTVELPTQVLPIPDATTSGYFDILVGNTGAGQLLGDYQISLQVSSTSSGVSVTGVGTDANRPANSVYATNPYFSSDPELGIPPGVYVYTDAASNHPVTETIVNGSGLVRVLYTVQAGTVGAFNLGLLQGTGGAWDSSLNDDNANPLAFGVAGGSLSFAIPGDADLSGTVAFADYQILEAHFGAQTGATWQHGDFNGDHAVSFADYQILESHFGLTQVPEPAALGLLSLGGLAWICQRRRAQVRRVASNR